MTDLRLAALITKREELAEEESDLKQEIGVLGANIAHTNSLILAELESRGLPPPKKGSKTRSSSFEVGDTKVTGTFGRTRISYDPDLMPEALTKAGVPPKKVRACIAKFRRESKPWNELRISSPTLKDRADEMKEAIEDEKKKLEGRARKAKR